MISLFSQSLFALPLDEAIEATARCGYEAIELACTPPHFDLETARTNPQPVIERIEAAGLDVSALSLFTHLTDPEQREAHLEAAEVFIRLAPSFRTKLVKITPGPPGSAQASAEGWGRFAEAMERLLPIAIEADVRLAVETHMRQLTDTLDSCRRLMEMTPPELVGLTLDISNLAFAGEDLEEVVEVLGPRTINTHLKNGTIDEVGGWHFHALDQGLTDYSIVLPRLLGTGYEGPLTIECLGPETQSEPETTAKRDLRILRNWLNEWNLTRKDSEG